MQVLKPFIAVVFSVILGTHAMAEDRLPTISPDKYDQAQKDAAAHFLATRKVPVFGPFEPLMHSPELMSRSSDMGLYLRYGSAIGLKLSEFVIIMTARQWSQDYEWQLHARIAAEQGIAPDVIAAMADGRRPEKMTEEEAILYDFVLELHQTHRVSDATYGKSVAKFGTKGTMDVIGITGYYTYLAMVLNTARYPVPAGAATLPRFPEK
jgi:4-carboxymuconolactone decarboxylase